MQKSREQLQGEIRYAMRLCQRTARLYRRVQTCSALLIILAGSGALVAISARMSSELTITCVFLFAAFGAVNIAVRPAEKAAQNESDVRKYAALLLKAEQVDTLELAKLLAQARQSEVQEVEPLRDVAFNDLMLEINRADQVVPLRLSQRALRALA